MILYVMNIYSVIKPCLVIILDNINIKLVIYM